MTRVRNTDTEVNFHLTNQQATKRNEQFPAKKKKEELPNPHENRKHKGILCRHCYSIIPRAPCAAKFKDQHLGRSPQVVAQMAAQMAALIPATAAVGREDDGASGTMRRSVKVNPKRRWRQAPSRGAWLMRSRGLLQRQAISTARSTHPLPQRPS